MSRYVFIAPSYQQARWWIDFLGIVEQHRVSVVTDPASCHRALLGVRPEDVTIYACGSDRPKGWYEEIIDFLGVRGFEVIDAQDVHAGGNIEQGTWWLGDDHSAVA